MRVSSFTGERTVWYNPYDHLEEFRKITDWYMTAMTHCINKRVIDLGAGHGFGSFLLSTVAERMDLYDVEIVSKKNILPFVCESYAHLLDLEKEPVPQEADIAVAIEVIEHLANPDFMLENLKVKELFFTVPCYGNKNEFHKIEYTEDSCKTLILRHFPFLDYRMDHRRMIGYATK